MPPTRNPESFKMPKRYRPIHSFEWVRQTGRKRFPLPATVGCQGARSAVRMSARLDREHNCR